MHGYLNIRLAFSCYLAVQGEDDETLIMLEAR